MNYFDTHDMLTTVPNLAEMILYIDLACCTLGSEPIKSGSKAASQSNGGSMLHSSKRGSKYKTQKYI